MHLPSHFGTEMNYVSPDETLLSSEHTYREVKIIPAEQSSLKDFCNQMARKEEIQMVEVKLNKKTGLIYLINCDFGDESEMQNVMKNDLPVFPLQDDQIAIEKTDLSCNIILTGFLEDDQFEEKNVCSNVSFLTGSYDLGDAKEMVQRDCNVNSLAVCSSDSEVLERGSVKKKPVSLKRVFSDVSGCDEFPKSDLKGVKDPGLCQSQCSMLDYFASLILLSIAGTGKINICDFISHVPKFKHEVNYAMLRMLQCFMTVILLTGIVLSLCLKNWNSISKLIKREEMLCQRSRYF